MPRKKHSKQEVEEAPVMPKNMVGESKWAGHMPGARFTVLITTKRIVAVSFALRVFGALRKTRATMPDKFAGLLIIVRPMVSRRLLKMRTEA